MATIWTGALERLAQIITGDYGTGRTVTAGAFEVTHVGDGLGGDVSPDVSRQRTVEIIPLGGGQVVSTDNPYAGDNSAALTVLLRIGYRYDVEPAMTDTTVANAAAAHVRAVNDWWGVLRRAIDWPQNRAGLTPELWSIEPLDEGEDGVNIVDDGDGRVALEVRVRLSICYDPATSWDLG